MYFHELKFESGVVVFRLFLEANFDVRDVGCFLSRKTFRSKKGCYLLQDLFSFFLWLNIQILFSLFLKIFELKLNALIILYEEFNCF